MPAGRTMSARLDPAARAPTGERASSLAAAGPAYGRAAVLMHWLMAALILLNLFVGLYMATLANPSPRRADVLYYHASFGLLVLALAAVRLSWRIFHRPAPLPPSIPRSQRIAAHAVHGMLYVMMLLQPVTGYLHRMAGGHAVSFFGLIDAPVLISRNEPLRLLTDRVHDFGGLLLGVLVAGHVAAALKHRYVDHDAVMRRMAG